MGQLDLLQGLVLDVRPEEEHLGQHWNRDLSDALLSSLPLRHGEFIAIDIL